MWLTNRKAEWRALRKRRRSLAGEQSRLVQKVIEEKNGGKVKLQRVSDIGVGMAVYSGS